MALEKQILLRKTQLKYWAITLNSWNKDNNETTVNISPYVDHDARKDSAVNYFGELTKTYYYPGIYTIEELYRLIKEDEKFSGFFTDSIDC